jgi:hypothetical protein
MQGTLASAILAGNVRRAPMGLMADGQSARRAARPHAARWFFLGLTVGAGLAYLFDPDRGRRRRHLARDRVAGLSHRLSSRTVRKLHALVQRTEGRARGVAHRLHPRPVEELDDVELAHKVESILFRDPNVPKGQISINAEAGRVFLRGEVQPDLVADLEQAVRRIRGVRDVENLLHAPGTPPPGRSPGS